MTLKILRKTSTLTLALLLLSLLAVLSYKLFPKALYLFHKNFLNDYTPGLSLSKPLLFFLFLLAFSLAGDLLPKAHFGFRKLLTYQAIIAVSFVALALLGFLVFRQNIETYNALFPGNTAAASNGGLMYASYEARTLFFYSISTTDHYHENKALFFPLAKYLGVEGDMGEGIFPFYPLKQLLLGYLLLAVAAVAVIQSIRLLEPARRKLHALLLLYYAFAVWRLFHAAIDGGIFNQHMAYSLAAFLFFPAIVAYIKYPGAKAAAIAPYAMIAASPLPGYAVQALFAQSYHVKLAFGSPFQTLFLLEMVLVISGVVFLTRHGHKEKPATPRAAHAAHTTILANPFALLAAFLTVAALFMYANQLRAINTRTALDPAGSYAKPGSSEQFLAVTASSAENLCNAKPIREFAINQHRIRIYNASKSLSCRTDKKYYAYPIGKEEFKQAKLVLDCKAAEPAKFQKIQKKGTACYTVLQNSYEFFRFSASADLQGQHVFWAFKPPRTQKGSPDETFK